MGFFKSGENVFEENSGNKYVKIGWQQQVEQSLGIKDLTNFGYISGYKDSADDLVEKTFSNEMYIYPVVFLYRQYLELLLKNIIAKMPKEDQYKGELHNLKKMWAHISKVFKREKLIAKKQLKKVEDVVLAFHKVDPKSSNFRYFFKFKNKLTIDKKMVVDVRLMQSKINEVDTILYATYGI